MAFTLVPKAILFLSLLCLLLDASNQGNRAQAGNAVRTITFQESTEAYAFFHGNMETVWTVFPHPSRDGSTLLVTQKVEA